MKFTEKKLKNSSYDLEVALDHKEFLDYYQPLFDDAVGKVHLKGFRPGTAPKEMASKAVDKERVFEEAVRRAVQATLKEIAEDKEWQIIDQPRIEVLESKEGLKFKAHLTVFPQVDLGDYKKHAAKVLQAEKKEVKVDEKEIDDTMKWVLNSRAKLARVARDAKKGDVLDMDFTGTADGKALDGASGHADSFVLGDGKFVPGFEENLIGHKEGDKVSFAVTFPKDYWKEDMRNKKVDFAVTVHGVFERTLPELNDEFAKSLGKFETVAELKKNIRDGITKEKSDKEKERVRLKMIEQIIKHATMDIPEPMLQHTLDSMVQEYQEYRSASQQAGAKQEDLSDEALRKQLEPKAKESVATNLVLYQIAKDENLQPTPPEVEEEAKRFANTMTSEQTKTLDPQRLYDYSYSRVQNKKVFDFLESLQ
ncbi:trigger factor [Patescibacteria group bacterium]|nr:trigger factor [Patescibacteria group bacterium]